MVREGCRLPTMATGGAACFDLYAAHDIVIPPGEQRHVETGVSMQIPLGYEGVVRGRSGFARNRVYAFVGTIDSDYRGDVGVVLENRSDKVARVTAGMRIAQLAIREVPPVRLVAVAELDPTPRGAGGWGSTGA